jgi:ribonuclease HI
MAKKQKYYVVWKGHEPGIYTNWTDCQLQIKSYPGAEYKSFKTMKEAELAFDGNYVDFKESKSATKPNQLIEHIEQIKRNSISVDAACSGNPGDMEYRGVDTFSRDEIFRQGPFKLGTNNVGEFLALVHALALLDKGKVYDKIIYTDSRTAMAWVRNKRVKTQLKRTPENKILFELIDRGITWLKANEVKNPIVKWDTKNWGEIPADFGRK